MKTIIKIIVMGVGVLMIYWSFSGWNENLILMKQGVKTEGEVIQLIESRDSKGRPQYTPKIRFVLTDGKVIEFLRNYSSYPEPYRIGEKVEVIYLPTDPGLARVNTFFGMFGFPSILSIVGLFFIVLPPYLFVRYLYLKKMWAKLKAGGRRVTAKVSSVDWISKSNREGGYDELAINKRYQVIAQWVNPEDNTMYTFKSRAFNYNPKDLLKDKEGVDVYIDPNNPKKYYMDLEWLPKMK